MSTLKIFESRGLVYFLRNKLYISLTNTTNSTSSLSVKGPSFKMPLDSGFKPIEQNYEPDSRIIVDIVDQAFNEGRIEVSSMESEEITFSGFGEPLLRYGLICESAENIKDRRHGVPLRVRTNGLISSKECGKIAEGLKRSGIGLVSIGLMSDNPKQYADIMQPTEGRNFGDVCSFVIACVESGLDVTCTAVERPGVNVRNVRELSLSLGATGFATYPYCP